MLFVCRKVFTGQHLCYQTKTNFMKNIFLIIVLLSTSTILHAQTTSGAATQSVNLALSNAMEIVFTGNNNATGNMVNMAFTSADDYANGVESAAQELLVRSNQNFKVGVKYDINSFSYSGTGNLNTAIISPNAMEIKVTANSTGGSIAMPFTSNSYATLSGSDQDLILNGTNGASKKFSVKYKCTPGFGLPAGTYNINIVYTATQP